MIFQRLHLTLSEYYPACQVFILVHTDTHADTHIYTYAIVYICELSQHIYKIHVYMRMYVYMFIHTGVRTHVYVSIYTYIETFCSYGQFNTECILKNVIVFSFLIERDKYRLNIMP